METFNGNGNFDGNLFIGIIDFESKYKRLYSEEIDLKSFGSWIDTRFISPYSGKKINFGDTSLLGLVAEDKDMKAKLVEHIVLEAKEYIEETKELFKTICEKIVYEHNQISKSSNSPII